MALGLNDVNLEASRDSTRSVRENPALGKRTVKVRSTWQRGTKAQVDQRVSTAGGNGHPRDPPLRHHGGRAAGAGRRGQRPAAIEVVLAALAGCVTSGIAANAALFDVPIDGIEIDLEADIDFRGVLGHDKSVRNGFTDIRYTVTIKSPASEDKVRRCKETIDRKSPVPTRWRARRTSRRGSSSSRAERKGGRPGEVNCIFTKGLIPFVEKEVGAGGRRARLPDGGAVPRVPHGRPQLASCRSPTSWCGLAMELMGERRGALGPPLRRVLHGLEALARGALLPRDVLDGDGHPASRSTSADTAIASAIYRWQSRARGARDAPPPRACTGGRRPGHRACRCGSASGSRCSSSAIRPTGAARGRRDRARARPGATTRAVWEVRWKNPSLGPGSGRPRPACRRRLGGSLAVGPAWPGRPLPAPLPVPVAGLALGYALREGTGGGTPALLDLQSEEILYSNGELEKKFRDLETKIEQLSLLIDLSAAVNATLDPEKIYEQALERLVHRMGYQCAYLFLVDPRRGVVRGHRMAAARGRRRVRGGGVPLDPTQRQCRAGGRPAGPCS